MIERAKYNIIEINEDVLLDEEFDEEDEDYENDEWSIIEEMTPNMDDEEREDWLESLGG